MKQEHDDAAFESHRGQDCTELYSITTCDANGVRKDRPNGGFYVNRVETSKTLSCTEAGSEGILAVERSIAVLDGDKLGKKWREGGSGLGVHTEDVCYTETVKDVHAVAVPVESNEKQEENPDMNESEEEACIPLGMRNATRSESEPRAGVGVLEDGSAAPSCTTGKVNGAGFGSVVRRLTPLECERLMGFPDGWTKIPWKGRPASECPDTLRYKACGNSMCVNCMEWLGERIDAVERKAPLAPAGSLLDGALAFAANMDKSGTTEVTSEDTEKRKD